MNIFLLITCFALVASAATNAGYNYQQSGPGFFSGSASSQQLYIAPSQLYAQPNAPVPQYVAPNLGAAASSAFSQQAQQTIITKDFYIHSGPEENEEITTSQGVEAQEPNRKNYRIVFIKAPSHNIKFNVEALKRNQATNEEKTVIYVLSKKPDIATIQNQVSSIQVQQKASKPEVYFIKYKTQEEANRAQQEIQAEYEALGGSTSVSDEGLAPVKSVIGSVSSNTGSAGNSFPSGSKIVQSSRNIRKNYQGAASSLSASISAPSNTYLPVKKI